MYAGPLQRVGWGMLRGGKKKKGAGLSLLSGEKDDGWNQFPQMREGWGAKKSMRSYVFMIWLSRECANRLSLLDEIRRLFGMAHKRNVMGMNMTISLRQK